MSRTLESDFDDELDMGSARGPAGSGQGLALEKGSGVGHAGQAATYEGGGGMSFDDDGDDAGPSGSASFELDMPPPVRSGAPTPMESSTGLSGAPPSSRREVGDPQSSLRPSGLVPSNVPRGGMASGAPPSSNPGALGGAGATSGKVSLPPSQERMPASSSRAPAAGPDGARAGEPAAPPTPTPAPVVAKYPDPPAKVWETPVYFIRVLLRQLELRQDLTALRRRRSPDVRLYEAALGAHDKKTYALGMAITIAGVIVAAFLFFLPVFKRFLWND